MRLTTTPTFETVTYEEFLNHYGAPLGLRLIDYFHRVMSACSIFYDGNFTPEYSRFARSEDGTYWLLWDVNDEHPLLYDSNFHTGVTLQATGRELSLMVFSHALMSEAMFNVRTGTYAVHPEPDYERLYDRWDSFYTDRNHEFDW